MALALCPPAEERLDYLMVDLANFLGSRFEGSTFTPQVTRFREWEKDPSKILEEEEMRQQAAFAAGMVGRGG